MADYEHILVKRDGDTVTITMNRAARRNSLTSEHLAELRDAFAEAGESDATGIVLAADGPVFSAGHDFGDVSSRDLPGVRELLQLVGAQRVEVTGSGDGRQQRHPRSFPAREGFVSLPAA